MDWLGFDSIVRSWTSQAAADCSRLTRLAMALGWVTWQLAGAPPCLGEAEDLPTGYAGSAVCRECHASVYQAWGGSHHALAERPWQVERDAEAFRGGGPVGAGSVQAFLDADGIAKLLPVWLKRQDALVVSRVIGHQPLRQFLVPGPNGRLQVMDPAYDPAKREWFELHPTELRKPGEWGHWTGRGMNWNSMCAACHNTRLKKGYHIETDRYQTRMAEAAVSCEACHGPMQEHAAWRRAHPGHAGAEPGRRPLNREQMADTCGACHSRRSELTGDFVPGEAFHDHYRLHGPGLDDAYHPDGQVREESFEYASFLSSRMHDAGLRCTDCHDPHRGKPLVLGNDLCMRCHGGSGAAGAPVIEPNAHSRHRPDSAGHQCTACHMPQTTYMQRHPRHDHGFTIPDPALTVAEGVPNACNRCHSERDAHWAAGVVREWYGEGPEQRPSARRARWLAMARRGDPSARLGLIELLRNESNALWSATICNHLERWSDHPEVQRLLVERCEHSSAWVREAAVRALTTPARDEVSAAQQAVRARLDDDSRSVRVAAAWVLCASIAETSRAGSDLRTQLDQVADQPVGRAQRSQYFFLRGEHNAALAEIRRALEWDAASAVYHHDLAMILAAKGDLAAAISALRQACTLAPRDALFQYKLALALHETGDRLGGLKALEASVQADPHFGRAWYNLGLAKHASGSSEEALVALDRAASLMPTDPAPVHARATIQAALHQPRELLQTLQQLQRLLPDDPGVAAWLEQVRREQP